MVKSVDPDASYVVTGSKTTSKPKDLAITISTVTEHHEERTRHDFQKQESNSNMKEITSTLPLSLEEARSSRNHTGKKKKKPATQMSADLNPLAKLTDCSATV